MGRVNMNVSVIGVITCYWLILVLNLGAELQTVVFNVTALQYNGCLERNLVCTYLIEQRCYCFRSHPLSTVHPANTAM